MTEYKYHEYSFGMRIIYFYIPFYILVYYYKHIMYSCILVLGAFSLTTPLLTLPCVTYETHRFSLN